MKYATIFLMLQLLYLVSYSATINVDNYRPGAQYSNLQVAINNASAGDTILIHVSPNSYGNIKIDKKIYLKGPGHNISYTTMRARVGNIGLKKGSDSTIIDGLYIENTSISTDLYAKCHDVKIINNFFL